MGTGTNFDWVARCDVCLWVLVAVRPRVPRGVPGARSNRVYATDCPRQCPGSCIQLDDPPQESLVAAYLLGGVHALGQILPYEGVYTQAAINGNANNAPGIMYPTGNGCVVIGGKHFWGPGRKNHR